MPKALAAPITSPVFSRIVVMCLAIVAEWF
jgi:hypothetical protein